VLLLFSMCLQSFNWHISSQRLILVLIISFNSSNSILLIHYEFERGIKYVLAFSIIVFLQGFFVYYPSPVHVYIWTFDPMNTSAIHNNWDWWQCWKLTEFDPLALAWSADSICSIRPILYLEGNGRQEFPVAWVKINYYMEHCYMNQNDIICL
jgi:hypothetical protein